MKVFRKIIIVFLIMMVAFSCTACSIYTKEDADLGNGTNITETEGNASQNTNTTFFGLDYNTNNLPSSIDASKNISTSGKNISEQDREQTSSIKSAYDSVKNSAVAIFVSYQTVVNGSLTPVTQSGSGTIIDVVNPNETGSNVFYILTCHHVVDVNGATIQVCLVDSNGLNYGDYGYGDSRYVFKGTIGGIDSKTNKIDKTQAVTLVGGDKESDVAVLRLYVEDNEIASNIVKTPILDADKELNNLDEIFIIGNPTGGLAGTVTYGRVSGNLRERTVGDIGVMVLRQLDAGAWHGSSGGGVYNVFGELCGILNSGSDEFIGINYAVPHVVDKDDPNDKGFINVMKQLIGSATDSNYGYVSGRKAKFGFSFASGYSGVYISSVTKGEVAYNSGIEENDVVLQAKADGGDYVDIKERNDLINVVESIEVGQKVTLKIERTTGSYISARKEVKEITMTRPQFHFCNTGK